MTARLSVKWAADQGVNGVLDSGMLVGPEGQANAIHTMPGARFRWAVGKDVSQMGVTGGASDFHPNHAMAGVPNAGHLVGVHFCVETGPAASRIEFGSSPVQFSIADPAVVGAWPAFVVERTRKRPLGAIPSKDPKLLSTQLPRQFGVVEFLAVHGSTPR